MKNITQQALRKVYNTFFNPTDSNNLNKKWTDLEYILNSKDFTSQYLLENMCFPEVEHQVGRYLNMQNVVKGLDSPENGEIIKGDIIEFGTWQGLSLVYFARLLGANPHNRRLVGIDSFEGLPHDSNIWEKGDFSNTELNFVINILLKNSPNSFSRNSFSLIQGWFSDEVVRTQLYKQVKNAALIHFDADLYSSTIEALELVNLYLKNRVEPIYFLFDDWGCHPDEVPEAFYKWLDEINKTQLVKAEKISSTRFTRYYKITFN